MMPDIFTVKDQKVPLTYKKNSRAKRLSLKFSQREGVGGDSSPSCDPLSGEGFFKPL